MDITRLRYGDEEFAAKIQSLLQRASDFSGEVDAEVAAIIDHVRKDGDGAILAYTARFDALKKDHVSALEVDAARCQLALDGLPVVEREALASAAERIHDYHRRQLLESWEYRDDLGNSLGQQVTPLARVGVYAPGGKAAYPSSVLMAAVPARVAGVGEIILTAPAPGGEVNPAVLAAARLAGVDRVFTIGGAQAIAALAYGTETIPAVDKIVGPGNAYVAAAKRMVFGRVGIDMIAGPSEVVVYCDDNADAEWVALDLFAQAEHDEMAQAILICNDEAMLERISDAVDRLLPTMERRSIIHDSLVNHGALISVRNDSEALALIDRIAPEHLELQHRDAAGLARRVRNAGAIFVGPYSAESLGDYCAGPNHVLPTSGTARFSSPLGTYDFQKRTSIIHCRPAGARELARTADVLARAESLGAHAESARRRAQGSEAED